MNRKVSRRWFLGASAGAVVAAATLDPEALLWVPGKKKIFIPPPPPLPAFALVPSAEEIALGMMVAKAERQLASVSRGGELGKALAPHFQFRLDEYRKRLAQARLTRAFRKPDPDFFLRMVSTPTPEKDTAMLKILSARNLGLDGGFELVQPFTR